MARNRGNDVNDFAKMFLASYKMMGDNEYRDARTKYYNALADKAGKSMSSEDFDKYLKNFGSGGGKGSSGGMGGSGDGPSSKDLHAYFMEKGATPNEAAMLTGAAMSESKLTPGAIHDGGTGYGMFGHRDPQPGVGRKTNLFKDAGTETPSWKQQGDFALKELRASPQGKMVNEAKTPEDLTRAQMHFLRPQGYTPKNPENGHNYSGRLADVKSVHGLAAEQPKGDQPTPAAIPMPPRKPDELREPPKPFTEKAAFPADDEADRSQITKASYGAADKNNDVQMQDAGYTGSEPELGVEVFDVATGGAIPAPSAGMQSAQEPEQVEAPMDEVLAAALHHVQDSYGLRDEGAALPGTDPARRARLQAFHSNEQAMPPEHLQEIIKAVDPDSSKPDHNALAMQKLYGFFASKGDMKTAAQAAGSVLGAARQRSMDYGQDAIDALQKRDVHGATQALVAAYNEIPDGREVTAKVNDQGVGTATVQDAVSGKPVQEMPLNPQMLQMAAKKFVSGDEFYTHLSQFAASKPKQARPALMAAVGGPVTPASPPSLIDDADISADDDDEYDDTDDREDQTTAQEAALSEDGADDGSDAEDEQPAQAAVRPSALPVQKAQYRSAPEIIPYHPDMSADQRRMLDIVNRRRETDWRADMQHEQAAQRNRDIVERQEKGRDFRQSQTDKALTARQSAADKALGARQDAADKALTARQEAAAKRAEEAKQRDEARSVRQEEMKRRSEAISEHTRRMRDDPAYAREVEIGEIDQQQAAIPRNVPGRSESAQAAMEARYGDDTDRQTLEEQRLDVAAKHSSKRESFSKDPLERIKPLNDAMDKLIKSGKEEAKSGKIDTSLLPNIPDERKERMVRLADRIAGLNDIQPGEVAEAVYAITQKTDVAPKILRDGSLQVGSQRIVLDRETFRQLASLRGLRETEYAAAKSAVEGRKQKTEEGIISEKALSRERVDEHDEAVKALEGSYEKGKASPAARRAIEGSNAVSNLWSTVQDMDTRRKQRLGAE